MQEKIQSCFHLAPQDVTLIAAILATIGWLWTARRNRFLARKQHTLNVMLQASFNRDFRDSQDKIRPHIADKKCPDILDPEHPLRGHFREVLNHYELIAAGIRNGDFDERMVLDTQRGTLLAAYETCEAVIFQMRDQRSRQAIYEHLEWLHKRWQRKPPGHFAKFWELIIARPIAGKRVDPHG